MASEAAGGAGERLRLHPWQTSGCVSVKGGSFLHRLGTQARQFAYPGGSSAPANMLISGCVHRRGLTPIPPAGEYQCVIANSELLKHLNHLPVIMVSLCTRHEGKEGTPAVSFLFELLPFHIS